MTLDEILQARTFQDLVKDVSDDSLSDKAYKKLLRDAHPDLNQDNLVKANEAFIHLQTLHSRRFVKDSITIKTKKGSYTLGEELWVSSGVRYRSIVGDETSWLAYVSTAKATGSFISGHRNLSQIREHAKENSMEFFFPKVKENIRLGTTDVKEARILSASAENTRWFQFKDFRVVDPRDIAWIARRVFATLQATHDAGYLHGSPFIDSILIEPEAHGVMLKDWQYSVPLGEKLSLIDMKAKKNYPSWAKDRDATKTGKLDVLIAASAFKELASRNPATPIWMTRFFDYLTKYPTTTAHKAFEEFTEVVDENWGRVFHSMSYPN